MKRSQSGQILLITLLVLSVLTTVALALVSRSSTDVNISTQVEESQRAFSAAEAGIEEALRQQLTPGNTALVELPSGDQAEVFSYDVTGENTGVFEFPTTISVGEVGTFWMVPHANGVPQITDSFNDNEITFCFSDTFGAVIASVIFFDVSSNQYRVSRSAIQNPTQTTGLKNFNSADLGDGCNAINAINYFYQVTDISAEWGLNPADTPIMIRFRPVYSDTAIAVAYPSGSTFLIQSQGVELTSCGQVGFTVGAGTPTPVGEAPSMIEQCINVFQLYEAPDSIFDYVLYTDGSLSH